MAYTHGMENTATILLWVGMALPILLMIAGIAMRMGCSIAG